MMRPASKHVRFLGKRIFQRISRGELRDEFTRLGLKADDVVYAQISMRSLGFVQGGAPAVVEAILDIIGPHGTLVASAWPAMTIGSEPPPVFDVLETPSACGLFSEAVRSHEGARRSLNPIASVAAVGRDAATIVEGHQDARTPFGADSPFGRMLSSSPRLLLIGAHLGGLLRHVQDRVGYPNLYAPGTRTIETRDKDGRHGKMVVQMTREDLPPVVIMTGSRAENRDYLLLRDYALMFPRKREDLIMKAGYLRYNRSRFLGRLDRLVARGILSMGRVGPAEAALLNGSRMIEQLAADLTWELERFRNEYDPEQLALLGLPVL